MIEYIISILENKDLGGVAGLILLIVGLIYALRHLIVENKELKVEIKEVRAQSNADLHGFIPLMERVSLLLDRLSYGK